MLSVAHDVTLSMVPFVQEAQTKALQKRAKRSLLVVIPTRSTVQESKIRLF